MKGHKMAAVIAACALFVTPAAAVSSKPVAKDHHRAAHRHPAKTLGGCPVHRNAEGDLVDCRGWRYRSNAIGWDNTCFNLDYLPSAYACSPGGGW